MGVLLTAEEALQMELTPVAAWTWRMAEQQELNPAEHFPGKKRNPALHELTTVY
jgi:hypothetical protein